ncbi:unnamed protein product [Blepharisma stoltei]|uniref:Uncharacterized protein n=1 Tax=Blepharisma stoltei TaxID=1481888 RepID=A0AAU9KAU2_9CILI|nr:unnamed protein product [Blepharisma stoltei]
MTNLPLSIKTHTWKRDSHGLFDYESKNTQSSAFKTLVSGSVVQIGEECKFLPPSLSPQEGILAQITESNKEFIIHPSNQERFWLVVKELYTDLGNPGYKLSEGDMIKFGRIRMKVKEINSIENSCSKEETKATINEKSSEGSVCRFCLSEMYTDENPLISPCSCSGSMKWIHYKCLQTWLKGKVNVSEHNNSVCYKWHQLHCEICKDSYPSSLKVNSKQYNIIEVNKPLGPYIILLDLKGEKNNDYCLWVISAFDNLCLTIGRSHDNDISFADISVSRCHSSIRFIGKSFYLEDNASKFGTLILAKKSIHLARNSMLAVQCRRTVIYFSLKEHHSFISACLCCGSDNKVAPEPVQIEEQRESQEEEEKIDHEEISGSL